MNPLALRSWIVGAAMIHCAGGVMLAQSPPATAKSETVVITGCVAAGSRAGEYVLRNAKPEGTASTSPTSNGVPLAGASTEAKSMAYDLKGGDLKGHLGHQIAVTGTLEDFKPSTSAHQMPGPTAALAANVTSSALNVKSVKMIASSCP
jgi:hypothetical protein